MDLAELLMFEHAVIRIKSELIGSDNSSFGEMNRFVLKWHANIEDEIFFPTLREQFSENNELVSDVKRIGADHKLIQTLGENLEKWKSEGKEERFRERLDLYVKLLREHNDLEEEALFPYWKILPDEVKAKTMEKTVGAFNPGILGWYCAYTGISERFVDYLKE